MTNSWSPEDILNNEDAGNNWVSIWQTCHTIVNMLDALLADGGDISDDGQSNSKVGFKCIHYFTYSYESHCRIYMRQLLRGQVALPTGMFSPFALVLPTLPSWPVNLQL